MEVGQVEIQELEEIQDQLIPVVVEAHLVVLQHQVVMEDLV